MKKNFYLLILVSIFTISVRAQVTIGSQDAPHRGAVLELKSDTLGFLPPRVALSNLTLPAPLPVHVQGMVVFNTTDNPADTLQAGLYYNSGSRWMRLSTALFDKDNWFYMPSVVFNTSQKGTFSKDLYQEYKEQFTVPKAKNGGAPASVTAIPKANELYYYITDYDDSVFSNVVIDDKGMMTYDIIGESSDATFLNIVFVKK